MSNNVSIFRIHEKQLRRKRGRNLKQQRLGYEIKAVVGGCLFWSHKGCYMFLS